MITGELIVLAKQSIEKAEELFNSLLQWAFKGGSDGERN